MKGQGPGKRGGQGECSLAQVNLRTTHFKEKRHHRQQMTPKLLLSTYGWETVTVWSHPSSEAGSQNSLKITRVPLVYNKHPETVENFLNRA